MELVGNVQLIAGTGTDIEAVLRLLGEWGIDTSGNPDLSVETVQGFGVDDARRLRERAALKPRGARRVFVIAMSAITAEAQNALLKTLEEPAGNALFIMVHPAPQLLLPTLRSRAQIIELAEKSRHAYSVDPLEFIRAAPAKRVDLLKPLLEKGDDDKRDTGEILAFLAGVEKELSRAKPLDREGLDAVYRARSYAGDRGALVKPLLEQVALMLQSEK